MWRKKRSPASWHSWKFLCWLSAGEAFEQRLTVQGQHPSAGVARQQPEKHPRAAKSLPLKARGPSTPQILPAMLKCSLLVPTPRCLINADTFLGAPVLVPQRPPGRAGGWQGLESCLCVQNHCFSHKSHQLMVTKSWPSQNCSEQDFSTVPPSALERVTQHLGEIQH